MVRALRRYFDDEEGRRVLKVGDVFGVGVDEFDLEEREEGEEETQDRCVLFEAAFLSLVR